MIFFYFRIFTYLFKKEKNKLKLLCFVEDQRNTVVF